MKLRSKHFCVKRLEYRYLISRLILLKDKPPARAAVCREGILC